MNEELKELLVIAVRFIEDKGMYEEFKKTLSPDNNLEKMYYSPKDVDEWTGFKDI